MKIPTKINFFGRGYKHKDVPIVNGYITEDPVKLDALLVVNQSFIEEVANFLEKDPNNEYAKRITTTLTKGVKFE